MEFSIDRDVFLKSLGHAMELLKKNNITNFIKYFNRSKKLKN